LFTLVERFLSKFTNAAASITNETQASLQKLGIGKRLKWQVIQLGIPLTNIELHDPSGDETIKLLWVGRFTDIKDPLYAVNVLKELNKSHPNKFMLTMVGGGELLDEIKSYASDLPITFTGWLDKPFENAGYFIDFHKSLNYVIGVPQTMIDIKSRRTLLQPVCKSICLGQARD
jgi:glycosyltransferase involved in cell wall biosynthesis